MYRKVVRPPICRVKSITAIIREYIDRNDMTDAGVARKLSVKQQNFWKRMQKADMDTAFIKRISEALNHNFFADLSREYEQEKKEFNVSNVVNEPLPERTGTSLEAMLRAIVRDEIRKK